MSSSGSRSAEHNSSGNGSDSKRSGGYEAGKTMVSDLPSPPNDQGLGTDAKADDKPEDWKSQ